MELAQNTNEVVQATPSQLANTNEFAAMQKLKFQYFTPENAEQSNDAINSAIETVNAASGKVIFNFDPEKDIIVGYAIVISPINQRNSDGKTDCIGVTIGAIPTLAVLNTTKEGEQFVLDAINSAVVAKLRNSTRPNKTGDISASIPYTVSDFITSNRAEGILVAYRKLAPSYIQALKGKHAGFKNLVDAVFRQTLTSTAFAEATFAKIPQSVWVNIIQKMIAAAEREGMQPGMLTDWLQTRDNAGLPEIEEVNIDDLMDLGL